MAKSAPLANNFNGGEWSGLLYGRVDLARYPFSLQVCENYVPLVQGPLTRRPGTKYVGATKDHSVVSRLMPFQFSVEQAYVLVWGDQNLRFVRNNGIITETATAITGITAANPAVVTDTGHTKTNGDFVFITGVVGDMPVVNKQFEIANSTANTYELVGLDTTGLTYTSGGTSAKITQLTTPYLEADLFQVKFTQSADVLYLTHKKYEPQTLIRSSHTSWSIGDLELTDGPYLNTNVGTTTMVAGAATGTTTLTASAVTGINNDEGFKSTDVGRHVRMKSGGNWAWAIITVFTSTTVVTISIQDGSFPTVANIDWRLGVYSDTTGWPVASVFYDDRLWLLGGVDYPQFLAGSRTGDYQNFAPTETDGTVVDDNAIYRTLGSNTVNAILWAVDDERGMLVGTTGGEWLIRASQSGDSITPSNALARRPTVEGSADIQALRLGKSVLFVQRAKRKLRELAYLFEKDGFQSPDMTRLAPHVTRPAVTQLASAQEPHSILWAPRSDGQLLGLTFEREEDVVAWHRQILGGASDAAGADAIVESVAVVPEQNGAYDEVYLTVKRYIDGAVVRYIEYFGDYWEKGDDQEDAYFVDCGSTYDGAAVSSISSGFEYAEGETLQCLVDGATHPDVTVSDGGITLAAGRTGSKIHVGYQIVARGQILPIESGARDGTAQGKKKRIHELSGRFYDTLGIKVGPTFDDLHEITFRAGDAPMDSPPPLFNGVKEDLPWAADHDVEAAVCWQHDTPLPGTIVGWMPKMNTTD